jgi:toxin secretion/phage lysis holin
MATNTNYAIMEPTTQTLTFTELLRNLAYIPAFILGLSTISYSILALLMVIDTMTGVMKSFTIRGKRSITSQILGQGLVKKLSRILIPITLAVAGKGVGIDVSAIATGSLGLFILAEVYSILGNARAIQTGVEVHEFDALEFVFSRLQDGIKTILTGGSSSSRG